MTTAQPSTLRCTARAVRPHAASLSTIAAATLLAMTPATAQTEGEATQRVEVTGSRIKSLALTASSPVSQVDAQQIGLWRAATVEDISSRLPQLAGGVSGSTPRSDAFGAQTLDLRGLGQNRTLVLINGSRAVPFSFRNAVDVNFVPATLIRRVDVLTGGASAVYGADAVAGVVNFVMNDRFDGLQVNATARTAEGGAEQTSVSLTGGVQLGTRGSIVGYVDFTRREALLAGERAWALTNSASLASAGGTYTDVASGRVFSVVNDGTLSNTPQTTNYTSQYFLTAPLERRNLSSFFRYALTDSAEAYGRAMFSEVLTEGVPTSGPGQAPVVINQRFLINESNPFIPTAARSQLTFSNGTADVNINRSLGELGVRKAENDRRTHQVQLGIRGELGAGLSYDVYAQTGKSKESITILGDGVRSRLDNTLVNQVNIFQPGGADLSSLAAPFLLEKRERTQTVMAAGVSGDTSAFFKLPAGPIGFAVGAETRRERGEFVISSDISQSFNQAAPTRPAAPPTLRTRELYAEVSVPVLANQPGIHRLQLEAAGRRSSYEKSVGEDQTHNTGKLGLSWAFTPDVLLRAAQQSVIRAPNFGEFANPVGSIAFSALVTNPNLRPRYQGDPCALGTGNAAQCARLAPNLQPYDSLNAANLTGGYFFGGNPAVGPEKGDTLTAGLVITPRALPNFSATIDYYDLKLRDAIGVVQPVDALTSCYITDPSADNPLCAAVTRDPATGRILNGLVTDRNLARIRQKGVDAELRWRIPQPFGLQGHALALQAQVSVVTEYSIQRNAALSPIDCKGTYGSRCSSDGVSLVAPDYRHRVATTWQAGSVSTQLAWRRIGEVRNSAVNADSRIKAHDTLDLALSWVTPVKGLTVNAGIDNLTDKQPPLPVNPGSFNTFPDTYDVVGRTYGVSASWRF
ncbi:MAG: TonB-dependent receptor [Rubrivivax sp.]|nr:TonB-dependent receptor [Rubrivivax sp.]